MGLVYFITSDHYASLGYYKIGMTTHTDLNARLAALNGAMPDRPLYSVLTLKTDDPGLVEKLLHAVYRKNRAKGEWFRIENEDVVALQNLAGEGYFPPPRKETAQALQFPKEPVPQVAPLHTWRTPEPRLVYTLREAAHLLRISEGLVKKHLAENGLETFIVGRQHKIRIKEMQRLQEVLYGLEGEGQ
jgi:hypothetical protein